jgi:hypothetical protein
MASPSSRKPYQSYPGQEFEVDKVRIVEAESRHLLLRRITDFTFLSVGVTGIYGLITGAYFAVEAVWSVAGPIMGAVVVYYFGSHRKDSG